MKSIFNNRLKVFSKFLIIFGSLIASLLLINAVQADGVNYYVRPGGDDVNCDGLADADYTTGLTTCAKQTIQAAIDAAGINDIVNIAAGTYTEDLAVNEEVSLVGAGVSLVTIDLTGSSGHNNAGIYVSADNVSLQGFTLAGAPPATAPRYGIKFADVSGGSLSNLLVQDIYRSGYDFLGTSNTTISNIESRDNGGHGLALTDCNNMTLTSYTALGNGWQAISIATWGDYTPLGTSGIVLNGPFNMDSVLQLEMGDANNPGVPPSGDAIITYSSNPVDGADVTFNASDFGYALHGEQDDSPDQARIWFFQDLADARNAAALAPIGHLTGNDMYIEDLTDSTQLYVCPQCTIQAAVDAASPGDTVNVDAGTFEEHVVINKSLILSGSGAGTDPATHTILDGSSLGVSTSGIHLPTGTTGVTIEDLTVQNYALSSSNYAGISGAGSNNNFAAQRVHVLSNTGGRGGLYLNGPVDTVLIDNVTAHDNQGRGIVIWNGFKTNITITNNDVRRNNCCGIELQDGTASGVIMSGNTVIDNADSGMSAIGLTSGAGPNIISGNTLQDNGRFGIEIKLPAGTGLESGDGAIVVENNNVSFTSDVSMNVRDHAGIAVFRRSWIASEPYPTDIPTGVIVRNNTVAGYQQINPASSSEGFGIAVEGLKIHVYDNTLTNNDVGLQRQAGHLPYDPLDLTVDGDQNDLADQYFGRGNSPVACVLFGSNTFSGNITNSRTVGTVGSSVVNTDTGIGYCSIQDAIDDAETLDGHTISIGAGTYDEAINIEGFSGLSLIGENKSSVIIQLTDPLDLLCWDVGGYGCARNSVIRLVDSTDIVLQNMTIDGQYIAGNNVFLLSGWDSTGTFDNNVFENMGLPDASNYYSELGMYFRGAGFTPASRGQLTITNNEFIDVGRVAIVTHDYLNATITGNTFGKTFDDFGYGVEMGSMSTGIISDNIFYGFDTPAASDGSASAGIYIENAFTGSITSPIAKPVTVERNEIYDCQYGMWIGNGYDGFAGDVDIAVTLNDNNIHDNTDGGAWIQDEDQENGSSVTVTGSGNTLQNNGTYGYYIYTEGDGDITVGLTGETISGHDTGMDVMDTTGGTGTSAYDISINQSEITGNSSYGVSTSGPVVDATENWWGTACGPGGEGPGVGNDVTTNVLYSPWWTDSSGSSSATEGVSGEIIVPTGATTAEFQAVLNCAAPGTVVRLESGTYDGGLQVNSSGITIDLNGCTVGEGSPAFTINAADVTVLGPGTLDGFTGAANSLDPAVLVASGGDNFTLKDMEVQRWADGVEVEASVVSFKLIGNWIHSNTNAGLQINPGVTISGITTIEGNLFKANIGNGIQNDSGNNLVAEYNSWGHISGAAAGDGVSAGVDTDPFTYSEIFIDVEPDTQALIHDVEEDTSFNVAIKADGVNLYGLTYRFTYDTSVLTLNSTTFNSTWAGRCFEVNPPQPAGTIFFRCNLFVEPEWTATGGTIATFNFTAEDNGGLTGNGPWAAYFDIDPVETSSAAMGGVKVYVNNAGFNASSTTNRDITNTASPYDGQINISGVTQFTGFIDLQGTFNDSGGLLTVYNQAPKLGATAFATATSSAGGGYTTTYLAPYQLAVGTEYWLYADAPLYLPTTALSADDFAHSSSPTDRPFTSLNTLVLLGGDGTDDDVISILDLTCIGASYQGTSTCTGGPGADADVNGDGVIDILDLVLMGGNYDLTASPWTPIP